MKIVFFDGYCSLCNGLVDWLMKTDKTGELKFASLQGETAVLHLGSSPSLIDIDTVIYFRDGVKFERSTAILRILIDLGGVWRLADWFLFVPRPLRDLVYRVVAKNRYRIFGKRETCRIPSAVERARLLP